MPVNTLKTPDRKELINLATLRDKLSPRLRIYASLPVTYIVNHAKLLHRVLTNVCDHQNSREKSVKKLSAKSSAQEQHHATYWGQHYNTIFRCVSRERYYQKMTLKNRDINRLRNYCLNRKERVIRQEFSKSLFWKARAFGTDSWFMTALWLQLVFLHRGLTDKHIAHYIVMNDLYTGCTMLSDAHLCAMLCSRCAFTCFLTSGDRYPRGGPSRPRQTYINWMHRD